jgi:hypothetical protein
MWKQSQSSKVTPNFTARSTSENPHELVEELTCIPVLCGLK